MGVRRGLRKAIIPPLAVLQSHCVANGELRPPRLQSRPPGPWPRRALFRTSGGLRGLRKAIRPPLAALYETLRKQWRGGSPQLESLDKRINQSCH